MIHQPLRADEPAPLSGTLILLLSENLDTVVAEIHDVDGAVRTHGHLYGTVQPTGGVALFTKLTEKLPRR